MKFYLIILLGGIGLLFSAQLAKPKRDIILTNQNVPGIVFLTEHMGMDRTEITNFHWLEYTSWMKRCYGESSAEYTACLPDSMVWDPFKTALPYHKSSYFTHPAYRDFPVVGLSFEQMEAYCIWRSDRVLEYALVKKGALKFTMNPVKDSLFNYANYLSGKVPGIKKRIAIDKVPHYHLPSKVEWESANNYAEKVYLENSKRTSKYTFYSFAQNSVKEPTLVSPSKKQEIKNAIYNLHRNVSEQLNEKGLVAGENWIGKQAMDQGSDFSETSLPSAGIGFRCAFNWKYLNN